MSQNKNCLAVNGLDIDAGKRRETKSENKCQNCIVPDYFLNTGSQRKLSGVI